MAVLFPANNNCSREKLRMGLIRSESSITVEDCIKLLTMEEKDCPEHVLITSETL